ncbi:MAG: RNA 2',3'-cyclic phosphodiesterase [Betaproteobacteria bacterium]|nr:MAG: RNA 2',3'-cyclic phosphodiesterase [Betaproteobacteria bacterium]
MGRSRRRRNTPAPGLKAPAATPSSTRLFFAAWPAPDVQQALGDFAQSAQRECGGRLVPSHNIHLTLVFLGAVAHERLEGLEALAATIEGEPFALTIDRVDYWRHNRIVWAGVKDCPDGLTALVKRMERALGGVGFQLNNRPYVPHITLLRDARRPPARSQLAPIAWPVSEFALVESVQLDNSQMYEVLQSWRLGTKSP